MLAVANAEVRRLAETVVCRDVRVAELERELCRVREELAYEQRQLQIVKNEYDIAKKEDKALEIQLEQEREKVRKLEIQKTELELQISLLLTERGRIIAKYEERVAKVIDILGPPLDK